MRIFHSRMRDGKIPLPVPLRLTSRSMLDQRMPSPGASIRPSRTEQLRTPVQVQIGHPRKRSSRCYQRVSASGRRSGRSGMLRADLPSRSVGARSGSRKREIAAKRKRIAATTGRPVGVLGCGSNVLGCRGTPMPLRRSITCSNADPPSPASSMTEDLPDDNAAEQALRGGRAWPPRVVVRRLRSRLASVPPRCTP